MSNGRYCTFSRFVQLSTELFLLILSATGTDRRVPQYWWSLADLLACFKASLKYFFFPDLFFPTRNKAIFSIKSVWFPCGYVLQLQRADVHRDGLGLYSGNILQLWSESKCSVDWVVSQCWWDLMRQGCFLGHLNSLFYFTLIKLITYIDEYR